MNEVNKDTMHEKKILILDFGSQYTQLITRRIRESGVYSEILPYDTPLDRINGFNPQGIVLSGSPYSVTDDDAPIRKEIFELGLPILGICYGMQLITHLHNGVVSESAKREYGRAQLEVDDNSDILAGFEDGENVVWMSHGDRIEKLPDGFERIAHTENAPVAAMKNSAKKIYALQFHPEVVHTPNGKKIIDNFIHKICGCPNAWTMHSFMEQSIEDIKERIGDKKVICGLSGGVDSSVAAVLIHQSIGKNLTSIFVNNGLLRKNEAELVLETFKNHLDLNLVYVDASDKFLDELESVVDPEQKRKIIGRVFIEVFDEAAKKIGNVDFLAQGTLYPDVIESVSFKGPSATIKSHHNVGGLPEKMNLKLVEPLRELFKDEVRQLGSELGIADELIERHPFPGPGLAVRILGEITKERLAILREADDIYISEIRKAGLYNDIWQAFAVLLPVKTVGVMGDKRTYEHVIALRAVTSRDGMTADWSVIPPDVLGRISNRIINEVKGANRVVYDISSKPPSTIEWE